jgi:hypothetical protein
MVTKRIIIIPTRKECIKESVLKEREEERRAIEGREGKRENGTYVNA